jgi:hypothetical protein
MLLSLAEVTRIAETVAREQTPRLKIAGVASRDGDSGRVELLVTVTGCHAEPCTLVLNLSREEPRQLRAELERQLTDAVRAHQTADER